MKFIKFFIAVFIIIAFNNCSRFNLFTESRYDYLNKVAVNTKKDTVKINEILTIAKENEFIKDSIAGESALINSNDKKNNSLNARENLKQVLSKAGNNFKHSNLAENKSLTHKNSTELMQKKQAKIEPKRITAAGRSEYAPVESNSTSEGKAKNRRTEIILTPKLDELFKIIESN